MYSIAKLPANNVDKIQHNIDIKTKPLGALGQLETLALQLCQILGHDQPRITKPTQLVFAGDHGVSEMGISIAGCEVTGQMVANFCAGGAAINALSQQANMSLTVIDCGTVYEQPDHPMLIKQRVGDTTAPIHIEPAMSEQQARYAINMGLKVAQSQVDHGSNVIGIGEMGIGNTTSAAAIMKILTGHDIDYCVGRGTGIDDDCLNRKKEIIRSACLLHQDAMNSPISVLSCLGGFEIAQMVGAMIGIAQRGKVIIVDGFISSVAALLAVKISPNARDYMIFSHQSHELGHHMLLKELNAKALLSLNLRLGEGSGCPLVLPLMQSALAFYNHMASFEQAHVTKVN